MQLNSTCKIIQQIFQTKTWEIMRNNYNYCILIFFQRLLYKNLNILLPNYELYSIITLQNDPCLMDSGKEQVVFSVLNTYIHTLTHPNSSYVHHWYSCKQRNPVGREPLLCLVHIVFCANHHHHCIVHNDGANKLYL